jgi:hypothetical protein
MHQTLEPGRVEITGERHHLGLGVAVEQSNAAANIPRYQYSITR